MSMLPKEQSQFTPRRSVVAQRLDFVGDRLRLAIVGGDALEHGEPLLEVDDLALELGLARRQDVATRTAVACADPLDPDRRESRDGDDDHDGRPKAHCSSPWTTTGTRKSSIRAARSAPLSVAIRSSTRTRCSSRP